MANWISKIYQILIVNWVAMRQWSLQPQLLYHRTLSPLKMLDIALNMHILISLPKIKYKNFALMIKIQNQFLKLKNSMWNHKKIFMSTKEALFKAKLHPELTEKKKSKQPLKCAAIKYITSLIHLLIKNCSFFSLFHFFTETCWIIFTFYQYGDK